MRRILPQPRLADNGERLKICLNQVKNWACRELGRPMWNCAIVELRSCPPHQSRFPSKSVVGEDLELDLLAYEPRRVGRVLKLERVPMELLLLFNNRMEKGQLVTRNQVIDRIWGKDVFLDTDNSINAAICKIVLKDDPEQPCGGGFETSAVLKRPSLGSSS